MYSVKEIYPTLQGEGYHTGRPAVFLRFSGCNLWSGHEADRNDAVCSFCDTDFVGMDGPGGGRYTLCDLSRRVSELWEPSEQTPFVVMTGGEPMLQVDEPLIAAIRAAGFEIAIETNGTIRVPRSVDWICVSPKAGASLVQRSGDELKLVYPQNGAEPHRYQHLDFRHFFLQPMDGPCLDRNVDSTVAYCRANPPWQVSIQSHKYLGIP